LRCTAPAALFWWGHADCGAYGGASKEVVIADLIRSVDVLRVAEPSLAVECYFADFYGVYAVKQVKSYQLTIKYFGSADRAVWGKTNRQYKSPNEPIVGRRLVIRQVSYNAVSGELQVLWSLSIGYR
jgi:hypothetical protein